MTDPTFQDLPLPSPAAVPAVWWPGLKYNANPETLAAIKPAHADVIKAIVEVESRTATRLLAIKKSKLIHALMLDGYIDKRYGDKKTFERWSTKDDIQNAVQNDIDTKKAVSSDMQAVVVGQYNRTQAAPVPTRAVAIGDLNYVSVNKSGPELFFGDKLQVPATYGATSQTFGAKVFQLHITPQFAAMTDIYFWDWTDHDRQMLEERVGLVGNTEEIRFDAETWRQLYHARRQLVLPYLRAAKYALPEHTADVAAELQKAPGDVTDHITDHMFWARLLIMNASVRSNLSPAVWSSVLLDMALLVHKAIFKKKMDRVLDMFSNFVYERPMEHSRHQGLLRAALGTSDDPTLLFWVAYEHCRKHLLEKGETMKVAYLAIEDRSGRLVVVVGGNGPDGTNSSIETPVSSFRALMPAEYDALRRHLGCDVLREMASHDEPWRMFRLRYCMRDWLLNNPFTSAPFHWVKPKYTAKEEYARLRWRFETKDTDLAGPDSNVGGNSAVAASLQ